MDKEIMQSVKVIVVNGSPQSGKSSFEGYCAARIAPYCRMRSTVDKVKEIALYCGWDGVKDDAGRRLLSDLKDALTHYNDLPFNDIVDFKSKWEFELNQYGIDATKCLLFVDCREPERIDRLKHELGAKTLLIHRTDAEQVLVSNHSDANIFNYPYDYIIDNNGTLDELKYKAIDFLKKLQLI